MSIEYGEAYGGLKNTSIENESSVCLASPQTIKGVDENLSEEMHTIISNMEEQQKSDKFCEKTTQDLPRNRNNDKFVIENGCLNQRQFSLTGITLALRQRSSQVFSSGILSQWC